MTIIYYIMSIDYRSKHYSVRVSRMCDNISINNNSRYTTDKLPRVVIISACTYLLRIFDFRLYYVQFYLPINNV